MSKVVCYMIVLSWAVAVVLATASTSGGGRSSYPRTNRGFKNAQLSTARGFGKRDRDAALATLQQQVQPLQNFEGLFSSDVRSSYPNAWLIEELQSNPEIARFIVERFIDENGDGELTPDELENKIRNRRGLF